MPSTPPPHATPAPDAIPDDDAFTLTFQTPTFQKFGLVFPRDLDRWRDTYRQCLNLAPGTKVNASGPHVSDDGTQVTFYLWAPGTWVQSPHGALDLGITPARRPRLARRILSRLRRP